MRITEHAVIQLALDRDPMVVEVRKQQERGYHIARWDELEVCPHTRRPRRRAAACIYMLDDQGHRIIVKQDGSVLEGWNRPGASIAGGVHPPRRIY
jgi:hypothetical protein